MSLSSLFIFAEIFLVLLIVAGFIFYYLNNLNNELLEQLKKQKAKLKDEKKHAKGLRITIQQQLEQIKALESQLAALSVEDSDDSVLETELEEKVQQLSAQVDKLKSQLDSKSKIIESLNQSIEQTKAQANLAEQKIQKLENELADPSKDIAEDFENLYYELRNAIAYNMTGGEMVLERLQEHLDETGNEIEGAKLRELKERYSSLGEMVGVVGEIELFNEDDEQQKKDEKKVIDNAQQIVKNVSETLQEAQDLEDQWAKYENSSEKEISDLRRELAETNLMNKKLRDDLDNVNDQLMRFVAKARLFQAQKEQMKASKATQNQMHRNYMSLSADYKALSRKFKTLQARNNILTNQLAKHSDDKESIEKLNELRSLLENKEEQMDRLELEKQMLEQQFMLISKESDENFNANRALERLKSEHALLEQQFIEVLNELESNEAVDQQE
ncbi:hypothetical protein [Aliikangiella maris]|uniref:Uncharacterized protein n=2 Tax=Aliikangiella maris TaxID=3162458 RepID=A0ABV3MMS0_9GAMM